MTRIVIICEGQTEKDFVKKLVIPHLSVFGINAFCPIIGKPNKKGGDVRETRILNDVITLIKNDKNAFITTFFDFYGMKSDVSGKRDAANKSNHQEKKQIVEDAIFNLVREKVGDTTVKRFKPYIQIYEFEGLLFSNIKKMSYRLSDGDSKIEQKIQNEFGKILESKSPEEINDSKDTAPSKRIEKMVFNYSKIINGISLAEDIGLKEIREKCHLFNDWICWMENLGKTND